MEEQSQSEVVYDTSDSQPEPSGNNLERNEKGQFVQGHEGLGGRPKGSVSLKTKIIQRLQQRGLDGREIIEHLADNIIQDALDGKNYWDKEILHQLDGMPRQKIGLEGGEEGSAIQINLVKYGDDRGSVSSEEVPSTNTESV